MFKQGDDSVTKPDVISLDQLEKDEKPAKDPLSPERQDEESVSGTMPDPESDDDTLKNAQNVGLQVGESPESPEEIDIARDVDKSENFQKTH